MAVQELMAAVAWRVISSALAAISWDCSMMRSSIGTYAPVTASVRSTLSSTSMRRLLVEPVKS